jgi:hypothetical protein
MTDWTEKVESGRTIMRAPRLSRSQRVMLGPQDEKFALGDLMCDVEDDELEVLAQAIGFNLTAANLKSYREVAYAWPPGQRVAASWTVHRTLKNMTDRFEVIRPGMTLREAVVATGKHPADTEHPSRWSIERRVPFIIAQLLDVAISKAVRKELDGRKGARAARAAAKMVDEDRSAEYREALRALREKRDVKHPDRAAYEVIFRLREEREYVRAVGKASSDEVSFLPSHLRPDVIVAIRDLVITAVDTIALSSLKEDQPAAEALDAIRVHIGELRGTQLTSQRTGIVIPGEVQTPTQSSEPKTISGRLA